MNQKALKTLEYHKIITQLAQYASSDSGKELCRNLIPSTDYHEIVRAQQETTDAATRVRQKGSISFGGVRDIRPSLKRLDVGSALGMAEILSISSLLTVSARVKAYGRHEDSELPEDSLEESFRMLEPLTPVNTEIKRCILSEEEVSDDASPGLHHVRRSMRSINDKIHTQLNSILNSNRTYLQDAVITMRDGRYCLPVKSEHKSQVSGMVHDQSSTGSTLFIEPMAIVKLNNDLRALEIQEQKEIEMVLADLSNQLAPYLNELETDFEILTKLDFIFAKAALSKHYNASEPIFNTKRIINIKDGRHPLLDPSKVVPITIHLGRDFDLLIVTGPNTGGKTVSLKTVGLFTLMGQSGLHIPAFDGSELAVFDEVFADIGDEQSIEQSLSTFSAHMTNIVHILGQADSNSLCLFDELGAGTDPTEGAALAISILSFLHNMKCRTMATTHYSELKVFALTTPGVENACCEFNVETLKPTYRLLIGVPGKSNAFAISQKLGLPDYIIDDAKTHLEAKDETFEDLLTHLEENRVTIEKERIQIASYKLEVEQLKTRLTQKEERLDERRDHMIREAKEEAQRILRDAKETADQTIRSINKLAADSGVAKELEAQRSKLRNKLQDVDSSLSLKNEKKQPGKQIDPRKLKLGDGVKVLSMNLNGTVSSLPNAKGDLYVQMGILRSLVNLSDLELLHEESVSTPAGIGSRKSGSGSSSTRMSKSFSISPEINLIGMTTDEAIPQLDKYLDDAYLAHLPQVRVVHGRGTGALKNAVHKHLKKLKYVKDFRLGAFGEGDSGVTIVTFK
ncbi:endonuclease MutS2 [Lacrimispora saccharolytica]|uniref:Endonuclease MutS2 n=1 Tax=Lacrimispora saccharolytica (strain ATCC 35040 / DSM 2544 / NRCC 2533 / WM1) TaxID=610130 RepID=D9R305_LACSW|nr:endonuclease MutS2 [Lacrimispora saccharolytica]ADL02995.1 MutS2 family protein [[Clostridium] saccharolyticum WM1]QRV18819.1 endonuclease MutS2 [Lacrimispora saccharolytica]